MVIFIIFPLRSFEQDNVFFQLSSNFSEEKIQKATDSSNFDRQDHIINFINCFIKPPYFPLNTENYLKHLDAYPHFKQFLLQCDNYTISESIKMKYSKELLHGYELYFILLLKSITELNIHAINRYNKLMGIIDQPKIFQGYWRQLKGFYKFFVQRFETDGILKAIDQLMDPLVNDGTKDIETTEVQGCLVSIHALLIQEFIKEIQYFVIVDREGSMKFFNEKTKKLEKMPIKDFINDLNFLFCNNSWFGCPED
jgi:hypothetical protein